MELNRLEIVETEKVDTDFICNILQNAYLDAKKVDDNTMIVMLDNTKVIIKIKKGLISLQTILCLDTNPDYSEVALKCNECNGTYIFGCYTIKESNGDILFCTYHPIPIYSKISIPDFIHQLRYFATITREIWDDALKDFG